MKLLPWNWLKRRVSAKIKCCGYFWYFLHDSRGTSPEALGPADIVVETRVKFQQSFVLIKGKRMGSYLLKAQLQMHSTGALFCIFLWSNNQLLSKFYFWLIFFPYLNQLIELFRSKEYFKEKVDSDNNWKAAWPRVSLKCHLFLRLSLGILWEKSKFLPKRCLLIFCIFLLKWTGVHPTSISKKIHNSTSHKA